MARVMVDVCSGLGGASESPLQNGWDVYRIDNNPALAHIERTSLCDITAIRPHWLASKRPIDLFWASVPCLEFSTGYAAPGPKAARAGEDFEPDLTLLKKAIEIRDNLHAKWWVFENVRGSIKHFAPLLGEPSRIIGPFVLWTNLPTLDIPYDFEHLKKDHDTWSDDPMRSNKLAKIPFEISDAVRIAAECPTLEDF